MTRKIEEERVRERTIKIVIIMTHMFFHSISTSVNQNRKGRRKGEK